MIFRLSFTRQHQICSVLNDKEHCKVEEEKYIKKNKTWFVQLNNSIGDSNFTIYRQNLWRIFFIWMDNELFLYLYDAILVINLYFASISWCDLLSFFLAFIYLCWAFVVAWIVQFLYPSIVCFLFLLVAPNHTFSLSSMSNPTMTLHLYLSDSEHFWVNGFTVPDAPAGLSHILSPGISSIYDLSYWYT